MNLIEFVETFNKINSKEKRFNGKLKVKRPNIDHIYSHILIPDAINIRFKEVRNSGIIGIFKPGLFFYFIIALWFGISIYFIVVGFYELGLFILFLGYIVLLILFIIGVESTKMSVRGYLKTANES